MLSSRQLMLVHSKTLRWLARPLLPEGWTASALKTSGDVEAHRASVQTLGNQLAGLGVFSFLCKCVSSATSYFSRDLFESSGNVEAIEYLITTLMVQAIPSAMTLLFLGRFHSSNSSASRGTLMQSLLTRDDVSVAVPSDSAARDSGQSHHASQLASDNTRLQAELKASLEQIRLLQEEVALLKARYNSPLQ